MYRRSSRSIRQSLWSILATSAPRRPGQCATGFICCSTGFDGAATPCPEEALVKKWKRVDETLTPDGKTISLDEHEGTYTIRVDGAPLMSTLRHASEERIAELACAHLRGKRRACVLIGGLGFGFTLKASLAAVGPYATVVVAEILAAVIEWNRNPLFPLAAEAMADPR